jgi:hypothetical protein
VADRPTLSLRSQPRHVGAPAVAEPARDAAQQAVRRLGGLQAQAPLVPDAYLGRTPLAWLGIGLTSSSPAAVKAELGRSDNAWIGT